jgi:hypothetical protein
MQYHKILRLALFPSILFLLLSLVSTILTVHYWILGDWFIPHGILVRTDFDQRTQSYDIDSTRLYFEDKVTDATIASGVLGLAASIVALVACSTLREPTMDSQSEVVSDVQDSTLDLC